MALTPTLKAFAEFYCFGPTKGNAKRSAMAAGSLEAHAEKEGREWLKNAGVAKFIAEYQRTAAEKVGIDAVWMLERFKKEYEDCTEFRQYRDRKGNPVFVPHPNPEKAAAGEVVAAFCMTDPKAAAKFGEMIAKHLKMLTDRIEAVDPNAKNRPVYEPTTPEEAARFYQQFMETCG